MAKAGRQPILATNVMLMRFDKHRKCRYGNSVEETAQDRPALASLRSRSQGYLGYLAWVLLVLAFLWAANTCAQLAERWIAFLRGVRRAVGLGAPVHGPDYLALGGLGFLVIAFLLLAAVCYGAYRTAWTRRIAAVWGGGRSSDLTRIRALGSAAVGRELEHRFAYLDRLAASPGWRDAKLVRSGDSREAYCDLAASILRHVETDVAARAVTTGLIVGMNRNTLLDTLTIVAAAFELQLHVLTKLGKRPSLMVWIELMKRAGASVFLNTYVGREDALYLNLTIRKAALGVQMASDTVQEAAGALADVDWDEVLGGVAVPGLSTVTSFATMSMSVGAFGLRHIGTFIEATANDLLQGVLAGGVLYFHGMALAADCLALDREHRASAEMTRTVAQSMAVACAPAGRMLRDQVRRMRAFLRGRRQLALTAAKDAAKLGVDKLREASVSHWESVKGAGKLFR